MIYREVGRSGVRVSALGLGGHEYLSDGRLRGFQEDFALALTPGHVFPGFGGRPRAAGCASTSTAAATRARWPSSRARCACATRG